MWISFEAKPCAFQMHVRGWQQLNPPTEEVGNWFTQPEPVDGHRAPEWPMEPEDGHPRTKDQGLAPGGGGHGAGAAQGPATHSPLCDRGHHGLACWPEAEV